MNNLITTISIILICAAATAAGQRSFDLYQPIIDRAPFGKPPPGFDPTDISSAKASAAAQGEDEIQLSKEQEQLQKSVNATALVVDSTRTVWIGFTDTTDPKAPRNHYVPVGSSEDGWLVESADPDTKSVTFVKDGISIDVIVGKDGGKGPAVAQTADAKGAGMTPASGARRSPLLTRDNNGGETAGISLRSLRQRRREREAAEDAERNAAVTKATEAALAEAQRQREEDAAKRAEEEAARDAERAAEREELRERLKSLSADIEKRMAENRAAAANGEVNEEGE